MLELNFTPCKADPCAWLRKMRDKYKYIATYVDALLIASQEPSSILQDLKEKFTLKFIGDGLSKPKSGKDRQTDCRAEI